MLKSSSRVRCLGKNLISRFIYGLGEGDLLNIRLPYDLVHDSQYPLERGDIIVSLEKNENSSLSIYQYRGTALDGHADILGFIRGDENIPRAYSLDFQYDSALPIRVGEIVEVHIDLENQGLKITKPH